MLIAKEESYLSIYAFGPLGIKTETEVLGQDDLVGRKPRLLLERLLVARNSVVNKSAIADALWPRKAPQNAPATIESYISLLRKRLFTDRDLARRVIVTSSDGYRLNTDAIDLDLDRFDELTREADTLGPGVKSLELRIQADLLRRGAVLEDAVDEAWIEDVRYIYHDRASLNLVMIAREQIAARNFVAAIRSAEAAIELEPYSEEAFRVVMLGQYGLGHHTSARKTFARLRGLVWSDLGVDLTQVTEDLAAAIDAGQSPSELIDLFCHSVAPEEKVDRRQTYISAVEEDFREASRRLPFLGRKAELSSIHKLVNSGDQAGLQVALVRGVQGMGKTEFLNELEKELPFQPGRSNYADAGHHYFAEGVLGALSQAAEIDIPLHPEKSGSMGAEDALLKLVAQALMNTGPTAILLDDLDLASDSDHTAIRWLQDNVPEIPLTIVATMGPWLGGVVHENRQIPADLELELGPLTEADVAPCGAAGLKVLKLCKGNPHFMADMWRWRAAGLSGPPESLLAYVERRVQTMNEPLVDALHILTKLCSPAELRDLADQLQNSLKTVNRGLSILTSEAEMQPIHAESSRGAA